MIANVTKTGSMTVRIEFVQPFLLDFVAATGADAFVVVAYPMLRDNAGTTGTSADDIAYGLTTGQFVPGIVSVGF